jgi:hypothetical protein
MNKRMVVAAIVIAGQMLLTTARSSTLDATAGQEPTSVEVSSMPPVPQIEAVSASPVMCTQPETVVATMLGGYVAFVSATPIQPEAVAWSEKQIESMQAFYGEIILNGYAGSRGFGSLEAWAQAFGISQAPDTCPGPDCCNAGGALRFMYVPNAVNMAGWYDYPDLARIPAIQTGCTMDDCPGKDVAYHELAHLWDFRGDGALSSALDRAMEVGRKANRRVDVDHYYGRKANESYLPAGKPPVQQHGDFPRAYFDSADPTQPAGGEHFAETVAAYFLVAKGADYYFATCWTDEDPRCPAGTAYEYDRYDFMRGLFGAATIDAEAG